MPIPMYKNFTDADLEAIFSYLQTIPGREESRSRTAATPPAQPVRLATSAHTTHSR